MSVTSKKFSIMAKAKNMREDFTLVIVFVTGIVLAPSMKSFTGARFPCSLIASHHSVLDNPILDSIHELAGWYFLNRITPLPRTCNCHHLLYSSSLSVPLMYDGFSLNRESDFSRPNSFMHFVVLLVRFYRPTFNSELPISRSRLCLKSWTILPACKSILSENQFPNNTFFALL